MTQLSTHLRRLHRSARRLSVARPNESAVARLLRLVALGEVRKSLAELEGTEREQGEPETVLMFPDPKPWMSDGGNETA
jgi:hypothetical protein